MRALILAPVLLLSACATATKPEPEIIVQRVEVPVAVKCVGDLPSEPVYADTDAAILSTIEPGDMISILSAGRVLRIQFLRELRAAYSGCE